jgi:integrase
MPRKGKRRTLDTGIYQDGSGISVRAGKAEVRYGLGTPIGLLRQAREALKQKHDRQRTTGAATLNRDAARYMTRKAHLVSGRSVRAELDAWCALYGPMNRYVLTRDHVLDARAQWSQQGLAPKTINHRVHRLRALFRELDGPTAQSPTDGIRPLHVPRTPIQRIAPQLVMAVIERMRQSPYYHARLRKTEARFMVYAATGRRPSEIARTQPSDVDLTNRVWVPRDGKGGHTPGIYLNDDMLVAWRAFDAAHCWGRFNTRLVARTLRRYGWPKGVRIYSLRHAVGLALSEAGFDLADVAPMMGHKKADTTRRYYIPVLNSRLQKLSESLEGRFTFTVPQTRSTSSPKSRLDAPTAGPVDVKDSRAKKADNG